MEIVLWILIVILGLVALYYRSKAREFESLFELESDFYSRRYQAIGAKPIPVELDDLDRQMIPKLQGLVDSDPQALDKLPNNTRTILKEKGLNL